MCTDNCTGMRDLDRYAIETSAFGVVLMENAGKAVAVADGPASPSGDASFSPGRQQRRDGFVAARHPAAPAGG